MLIRVKYRSLKRRIILANFRELHRVLWIYLMYFPCYRSDMPVKLWQDFCLGGAHDQAPISPISYMLI